MKKMFTVLLAILMVFTLVACSSRDEEVQTQPTETATEALTIPETTASAETEVTEAPVSTEPPATTEPPAEETVTDAAGEGIRPEFQEAMDAYESFFAEYCELLTQYKENPTDLELLTQYSEMSVKVVEMEEAFSKWENEELSNEELGYYLEVSGRVMQKLADVSG